MAKIVLTELLKSQFPKSNFNAEDNALQVGSFPEWDSLAHFNFLLLVEESCGVRFSVEEMADLKSLADIRRAAIAHGVDVR